MSISNLLNPLNGSDSWKNLFINNLNANTITANTIIPNDTSSEFIVSPPSQNAKYTSIQSAINAAVLTGSMQTIIIKPGTYPEDVILPNNINLLGSQSNFNVSDCPVILSGKITTNYTSGQSGISNLKILSTTTCIESLLTGVNTYLSVTGCSFETSGSDCIFSNDPGMFIIFNNCTFINAATNFVRCDASNSLVLNNCFIGVLQNAQKNILINGGIVAMVYSINSAPVIVAGPGALITFYCFTQIGDIPAYNISATGLVFSVNTLIFSDNTSSSDFAVGTGALLKSLISLMGRTTAAGTLTILPLTIF